MLETTQIDLNRIDNIKLLAKNRWNIFSLTHTDENTYVIRYYPHENMPNISQFQFLIELEEIYNIYIIEHWYHERSIKVRLEFKKIIL